MDLRLIDIESDDLPAKEQTTHKLKALSIDGEIPALRVLDWLKRNSRADYKKIVAGLKIGASRDQREFVGLDRVSKDRQRREVYELKSLTGPARLFFFYIMHDGQSCIVLVHGLWKTSSKNRARKVQSEMFDLAFDLKRDFLNREANHD